MAWDSTAPTAEELAPSSTGWDSTPPTPEELGPWHGEHTLAGAGENLISDVKGTVTGLGTLLDKASDHPIDIAEQVAKGFIPGVVNEGKRLGVGELLTGHPINAVEKLGQAAYDKPLTTGMEVIPAVGAVGKALGIGSEGIESANLGAQAAKEGVLPEAEEQAAKTPLPVVPAGAKTGDPHALFAHNDQFGPGGTARSIYNVFGDPEHPDVKAVGWGSSVDKAKLDEAGIPITGRQPGSEKYEPIEEGSKDVPPKAPPVSPPTDPVQEVKDYIGGKYNKFASKPGMVPQIADYIQMKSQKMALQQLGASPMQARNLGKTAQAAEDAERAIGQYAMDKDIVGPTVTHGQMLARHTELQKAAGEAIGNFRKEAETARDPLTDSVDVLQATRAKLDPIYLRGGTSGTGKKAYLLALKDIENAEPTFDGIADAATKLNHNANIQAKINQPHSPYTDVANTVSRINNERIKALLGPEKAAQYDTALKEFGVNKVIEQFLKRKVGGEVKRIGAGSFTSNMIQKGMDEFGYRAGSKALNKTSSWVLKNPEAAKNLPSIFKEFIHQIDLPDEPTGMAHGGIVHEEMNDFLEQKYGKQK